MGEAALDGSVVLDLSRMLPGAVVARNLVDLGARVIKVEEPGSGDPLRHAPPLVDGVGAGFAAFFRGVESVALDLTSAADAAAVRRLARHADVVIESFRPGRLATWGLAPDRLLAGNPRLVVCSLSGFGAAADWRDRPAHDLNFAGLTGALARLGGGVPGLQVADVGAGLLATSAILAALLARGRTGRGRHIDQPLLSGPLPFLLWTAADRAAGGASLTDRLLAGRCACYRTYACADGLEVALAAIEPKFWSEVIDALDLRDLAGAGLDEGEQGARAAARVAAVFAGAPRAHWLALAAARNLPITAVCQVGDAESNQVLDPAGLLERFPSASGDSYVPGPFLPGVGRPPDRPAPRLGQHTRQILSAFGVR